MLKEQINPALLSEAPEVPCLFCTKNPRRNPNSDFCQPCWDEWKRTGRKPKAVIHGDGKPVQTTPIAPTRTHKEAEGTTAARKPALLERDDLTPEDLAAIQLQSMQRSNPMLTLQDGTKRVACTQCRQRPLVIARLCGECYDERMRVADWRAKLSIVKRGKGLPKLVCPWCGGSDSPYNYCCGKMQSAQYDITMEESAHEHSDDIYSDLGVKPL